MLPTHAHTPQYTARPQPHKPSPHPCNPADHILEAQSSPLFGGRKSSPLLGGRKPSPFFGKRKPSQKRTNVPFREFTVSHYQSLSVSHTNETPRHTKANTPHKYQPSRNTNAYHPAQTRRHHVHRAEPRDYPNRRRIPRARVEDGAQGSNPGPSDQREHERQGHASHRRPQDAVRSARHLPRRHAQPQALRVTV